MQLSYIDASGDPGAYKGQNTKFYFLSGVCMSYKDWELINKQFKSIIGRYFNPLKLPEIHSKELMTGRSPFNEIDHKQIADDLTTFISESHITLFGVVIDKTEYEKRGFGPPNTIVNKTLEEIINRFHIYLQRHRTLGIIISDAITKGFDNSLRSTYEYFRQMGTGFVRLNRIIDTIFFTPSETAVGIQMQILYLMHKKRNYENGDNKVFNQIEKKFDRNLGRTHGLKFIK